MHHSGANHCHFRVILEMVGGGRIGILAMAIKRFKVARNANLNRLLPRLLRNMLRSVIDPSPTTRLPESAPHMSLITPTQSLPDILGPKLMVVFCGINPGVGAAASGHHFVGRGNRFWRVLHLAGFTRQQMAPENDRTILELGYGLTTAVGRPTSRADQLLADEFTDAAATLLAKIELYRPLYLAFLGKAAYAGISRKNVIEWGEQHERFGPARVWVLPNPSGRNRSFSLESLVQAYSGLRNFLV